MIRIKWQPTWSHKFGGFDSDYYHMLWEKSGHRPYLDSSYWVWWEQWFAKQVNGKFVYRGDGQIQPISHIEFENDDDAVMFMLRCP